MPFNINPEDYRARVTELGQNDADELDKYLDVIADRRAEYTSRHTEVMAMDTEDLFQVSPPWTTRVYENVNDQSVGFQAAVDYCMANGKRLINNTTGVLKLEGIPYQRNASNWDLAGVKIPGGDATDYFAWTLSGLRIEGQFGALTGAEAGDGHDVIVAKPGGCDYAVLIGDFEVGRFAYDSVTTKTKTYAHRYDGTSGSQTMYAGGHMVGLSGDHIIWGGSAGALMKFNKYKGIVLRMIGDYNYSLYCFGQNSHVDGGGGVRMSGNYSVCEQLGNLPCSDQCFSISQGIPGRGTEIDEELLLAMTDMVYCVFLNCEGETSNGGIIGCIRGGKKWYYDGTGGHPNEVTNKKIKAAWIGVSGKPGYSANSPDIEAGVFAELRNANSKFAGSSPANEIWMVNGRADMRSAAGAQEPVISMLASYNRVLVHMIDWRCTRLDSGNLKADVVEIARAIQKISGDDYYMAHGGCKIIWHKPILETYGNTLMPLDSYPGGNGSENDVGFSGPYRRHNKHPLVTWLTSEAAPYGTNLTANKGYQTSTHQHQGTMETNPRTNQDAV
jgi:hypothetical protein